MDNKEVAGSRPSAVKAWIEAMRLRTLPVSCAGVIAAWAVALIYDTFHWAQGLICLFFAVAAQVASNFANEYFDYRNGLDSKGRDGFRRGVTEGDIRPEAMLRATLLTLGAACAAGLTLIIWGGWWLIPAGAVIALAALAYSAGPYPLSHHGLGDLTVILFFGLIPVWLTLYVMCPAMNLHLFTLTGFPITSAAIAIGLSCGLMAACVLIVNNVRDEKADEAVGKLTTAVIFGADFMRSVYILFAFGGVALMTLFILTARGGWWGWLTLIPGMLWFRPIALLHTCKGKELNAVLGITARTMLVNVIYLMLAALFG